MKSKSIDRIPSLRLHKPTGQAYVRLNGRMFYLGRHDKPDSRIRYNQMIAEWLANNRRVPVSREEIMVPELCAAYLKHAESYYVGPDGKPTKSLGTVKMAPCITEVSSAHAGCELWAELPPRRSSILDRSKTCT